MELLDLIWKSFIVGFFYSLPLLVEFFCIKYFIENVMRNKEK